MVVIKIKPRGRVEYEEKESQDPYQVDAPTPSRLVVENEPPTLASTLAEDEIVEVGRTNVNVSEQETLEGDEEGDGVEEVEGEEEEEGDFDSDEETDESTDQSLNI
ncbi:hypothetical protein PIB30_077268, partial [Stylosanthes scabra]|nr:hypothetical protein [Stylosanthes scabra]